MIIGIACVQAGTWAIGNSKTNSLMYHIKCDMDFFKKKTWHNIVIMGYNCLKSLPNGKPLEGRMNVVLCSKEHNKDLPRAISHFNDFQDLLIDTKIWSNWGMDVYIIGGGKIYQEFLPYMDKVYITKVYDDKKKGDIYFPSLDKDKRFEICDILKNVKTKNYSLDFITYRNKSKINIEIPE